MVHNILEGLVYLTCIAKIDPRKFDKQAIEAWSYYRHSISVNGLELGQGQEEYSKILGSNIGREPYLFMRNDQFSECSPLEISDGAMKFLRRVGPISLSR